MIKPFLFFFFFFLTLYFLLIPSLAIMERSEPPVTPPASPWVRYDIYSSSTTSPVLRTCAYPPQSNHIVVYPSPNHVVFVVISSDGENDNQLSGGYSDRSSGTDFGILGATVLHQALLRD